MRTWRTRWIRLRRDAGSWRTCAWGQRFPYDTQLRTPAGSIAASIREAYGRRERAERNQFLRLARGELLLGAKRLEAGAEELQPTGDLGLDRFLGDTQKARDLGVRHAGRQP